MKSTKMKREMGVKDLTPEELILALMYYSNGSIPGALYLQKLVFLAINEDQQNKTGKDAIIFKPLNFGPYSNTVTNSLQGLIRKELIVSKKQISNKYNRDTYLLTDLGKQLSNATIEKLNSSSVEYLRNLCIAGKQLGYSGILRYVYSKYPNYTSKSEIIDEVFKSYDY